MANLAYLKKVKRLDTEVADEYQEKIECSIESESAILAALRCVQLGEKLAPFDWIGNRPNELALLEAGSDPLCEEWGGVDGQPKRVAYYDMDELEWNWDGESIPVKVSEFCVVVGVWSAAEYFPLSDGLTTEEIREELRKLYPFP